jgi:PAS domain S-box-containing protein
MSPLKKIDTAELLDLITEGVVLVQENGRIAFSNSSFAELIGTDKEILTGMPFSEFVSREEIRRVDGFFKHLFLSSLPAKDRTEFSFKDRSGDEHLVEMNARTIVYENKTGVLASVADITESRKTSNELKKLLDLIPEVVLTTSPEDGTRIMNISNAPSLPESLHPVCFIFSTSSIRMTAIRSGVSIMRSWTRSSIPWNTALYLRTDKPNGSMTPLKWSTHGGGGVKLKRSFMSSGMSRNARCTCSG